MFMGSPKILTTDPMDELLNKVTTQIELDVQRFKPLKLTCLVGFDGHGGRNVFMILTPGGQRIDLACEGRWRLMSRDLLALIFKYQFGVWSYEPDHVCNVPTKLLIELDNVAAQRPEKE